jgi:hypothetical protein
MGGTNKLNKRRVLIQVFNNPAGASLKPYKLFGTKDSKGVQKGYSLHLKRRQKGGIRTLDQPRV